MQIGYRRTSGPRLDIQTAEMLDTDNLDATDSDTVGPADQTAQAMEETCKGGTGHGSLGLAHSANQTEPRYHLFFNLGQIHIF